MRLFYFLCIFVILFCIFLQSFPVVTWYIPDNIYLVWKPMSGLHTCPGPGWLPCMLVPNVPSTWVYDGWKLCFFLTKSPFIFLGPFCHIRLYLFSLFKVCFTLTKYKCMSIKYKFWRTISLGGKKPWYCKTAHLTLVPQPYLFITIL